MRYFLALAVLLMLAPAAGEDITLEQYVETTVPDREDPRHFRQVLQLRGDQGRSLVEELPREEFSSTEEIVVDFGEQKIYEINRKLGAYSVAGYRRIEKLKSEYLIPDRLENILKLPDGARKAAYIHNYDGQAPNPTREEVVRDLLPEGRFRERLMERYEIPEERVEYAVKRTGITKKICGYECEQYIVTADGRPTVDDAWVTTELEVHEGVFPFLKQAELIDPALVDEIAEHQGVPLEYTIKLRNGEVSRTETKHVSTEDLDAKLFNPDAQGLHRQKRVESTP